MQGRVDEVGGPFPGQFKWLRGVTTPDAVYALPSNASSVLKISTDAEGETKVVQVPFGPFKGQEKGWLWHGGVMGADGCIYGGTFTVASASYPAEPCGG